MQRCSLAASGPRSQSGEPPTHSTCHRWRIGAGGDGSRCSGQVPLEVASPASPGDVAEPWCPTAEDELADDVDAVPSSLPSVRGPLSSLSLNSTTRSPLTTYTAMSGGLHLMQKAPTLGWALRLEEGRGSGHIEGGGKAEEGGGGEGRGGARGGSEIGCCQRQHAARHHRQMQKRRRAEKRAVKNSKATGARHGCTKCTCR